ncbi:DUF3472 domain-containing protein [Compostibacter hankyongensis]|uniref:DUF3472 domain-containing protein n=2 Tax=Compostibacter hankyongensis TaxID=1007089 RepID=A0ABP8FJ32_9BACT
MAATVSRPADTLITVPLGGNTWKYPKENHGGQLSEAGIRNWTDTACYFITRVRVSRPGMLRLWLRATVSGGESVIRVSLLGHSRDIRLKPGEPGDRSAGTWQVTDTGYIAIRLQALSKTGRYFGEVAALKLDGTALQGRTAFVKNNEGNFFYWGRRGPSVHLNYEMPGDADAEWFYNEVTVPAGNDIVGSYFMADGFAEGYFGMQVNSSRERRILFSVWSPFHTDDPSAIPADQKILLVKKGAGVHAGEFGNEGSGGQSFLRYNWKANTTYRFLLHARPGDNDHTRYTAWFYAPEQAHWQLIASFSRPHTHTWLKHLHSFLENFSPDQGDITRKVLFTNQWVRDAAGKWTALTRARFTGDNTAGKGYRMDYGGGVEGAAFFLKNCGFFNGYTPLNTHYARPPGGLPPEIPFERLKVKGKR